MERISWPRHVTTTLPAPTNDRRCDNTKCPHQAGLADDFDKMTHCGISDRPRERARPFLRQARHKCGRQPHAMRQRFARTQKTVSLDLEATHIWIASVGPSSSDGCCQVGAKWKPVTTTKPNIHDSRASHAPWVYPHELIRRCRGGTPSV